MRIIGKIDNETLAGRFSRYLHSQQVAHELEESDGAWDVWIFSEDDLDTATELLKAFALDPQQPKYLQPPPLPEGAAAAITGKAEPRSRTNEKPTFATPRGAGPMTLGIIGICLLVHLLKNGGYEAAVLRDLFMTAVTSDGNFLKWTPGLPELHDGQYWRVLTPAIVHADWLHLLLNMFWLLDLGSHIERQRGWKFLGAFVVVTAIISNYGQYVLFNPAFCGMSGVLYGLLGYVWMRSKYDPASGLQIQPQALVMMLIWFGLCLVGIIPNVANGAHAVGLAVGTLWGILASLPAMRHTRA